MIPLSTRKAIIDEFNNGGKKSAIVRRWGISRPSVDRIINEGVTWVGSRAWSHYLAAEINAQAAAEKQHNGWWAAYAKSLDPLPKAPNACVPNGNTIEEPPLDLMGTDMRCLNVIKTRRVYRFINDDGREYRGTLLEAVRDLHIPAGSAYGMAKTVRYSSGGWRIHEKPTDEQHADWRWIARAGTGPRNPSLVAPQPPTCRGKLLVCLAMRAQGHGLKQITKRTGVDWASILKAQNTYGVKPRVLVAADSNNTKWGRYYDAEIGPQIRAERQHNAWWRKANPATPKDQMERYYANHQESKAYSAQKAKERYYRIKDTPEFKAKQFARAQLRRIKRQALGYAKTCRTHEYLGCTYQQAADHITAQLPTHWTWKNYGIEWEIDHKVQLSDGPLSDQAHIKAVCHYTNLRPLAVRENRTRGWGAYAGRQNNILSA